jgi:HlyD family secretion protein
MSKNKTQPGAKNLNESLMKSIAITPPIYKYVLLGILIICIIALAWGIFGSIPQRVKGIGMINTEDGVERITSVASGRISEIKVGLNDKVKAGDVIALVDQPELKASLDKMKFSLDKLKQSNQISLEANTENTSMKKQSNNLAINRLKASLKEINENIAFYEKRLEQEKEIYEKGLITYSQYFSTQQQLASDKIKKINIEEQLKLTRLDSKETQFNSDLNQLNIEKQIGLLELELEDMTKEYKKYTELTANTDGYVSQLNVKKGDIVSPEMTVGIVTDTAGEGSNYILNLYVPFDSNAVISSGMNVDIQIFSVDPYLHGYLNGKVKYVSQYMSDTEGLFNSLGNKSLIEFIDSKGGVYSVVVELEKNSDTYSGFSWSNGEGPQIKLHPGQLSLAYVDVKVKAPVDFILPIFEAYFD